MTIALIFSLGTCIVQIQNVWVNFACTERLLNLLAEAIINARNVRLCARWAIVLSKIKQIPFSCRLIEGFTFLKRVQSKFKMLLEMSIVLESIVSTEKMGTSRWLCNNSEIPLWLWKLWSLVVCTQSSFYVTRARKDDTIRQKTFFFAKKR